jgi:hypothetical protein
MQQFSVVLVGNGLLTAGAERVTPPQPTPVVGPKPLVRRPLSTGDPTGNPVHVTLAPGVATAVAAAIDEAEPAIRRQTTAVNARIEAAGGRGAGPALRQIETTTRALAAKLAAVPAAPAPVLTLAATCRRVADAARALRVAIAAGKPEAANAAAERYRSQAASTNAAIASFGLDGRGERRLFP